MGQHAPTAFVNGRVFTADAARSWAEAVAVRDGKVVAVGGRARVLAAAGSGAEVVDLAGRLVCPGFQDAHVHPISGGLTLLGCDLTSDPTFDVARDTIARYVVDNPTEEWVVGDGWRFEWFEGGTPGVDLLDELIPDRPAYLEVADGHAAWVNSRALERAGVTRDTPDPTDGRIERLPDGSPQGTLQEGAMALVRRVTPPVTPDQRLSGLRRGQQYLLSFGITAWQDAHVGSVDHDAYLALDSRGELKVHVRGALWWERTAGLEQMEGFEAQRSESGERYRAGSVKLMLDGVCENFTAGMLRPYRDRAGAPTENLGIDMIDPEKLPVIVTEVMAAGFQPHFHAIGDRAVRNALDAVEAARKELGWTDVRPHISHIQVIDPDDVPRFCQLGVIANAQALWACGDPSMVDMTLPFVDDRARGSQYVFGSLLRSGATLAMGSDWAVTTPNVLMQIQGAVTRTITYFPEAPPFLPEQAITLADALVAFTSGSSYVNFLERERGTLAPGMAADLVVLDRDPFVDGPIGETRVDLTMIDGEVVYGR